MITAICPNPSIDRELHLHGFRMGGTNRVENVIDIAGGKGINVAISAARLGCEASCIGFLPFDGREIITNTLDKLSISYEFIGYEGSVRVNQKVRDLSSGVVTELNSSGPPINEQLEEEFFELAGKNSSTSDIVIMSGSLPKGTQPGFYSKLVRLCRKDSMCIVDTDGGQLFEIAKESPYLLKPNKDEIEQFAGRSLGSLSEIAAEARRLTEYGTKYIVVSLGADGAMIVDSSKAIFAPALNVKVGSTVGAGDSMVAGICYAVSKNLGMSDILKCGVASASAWICSTTTGETFSSLLERVVISEID